MQVVVLATACILLAGSMSRLNAQPAAPSETASDSDRLADLDLEDLLEMKVYAASKFMQDVAQAPASVSIITAAEIRNHGYRSLADVLRSVRGFYVSYDRNYSYVGVRGFSRPGDYNGRILLLVNGHRLNDVVFYQALIGSESSLDVALFDRVEVIRGPSSSLYGTSAFFGVVNIVTRGGRSLQGVEVEGQTGSQLLRRGRVTAGGRLPNGFEGLVSVSGYGSEGNRRLYYPEFDTPPDADGLARDVDADRAGNIYGSLASRGFTLQGGFGSRRKTIPTGSFDTLFGDARTETTDARGFVDLNYQNRLTDRSTLRVRTGYDWYDYRGAFAYATGIFDDAARGVWMTGEASLVRQFNAYRIGERRAPLGGDVAGALVADLTLSWQQPSRGPGLAISLRNLFDAAYSDPGSVEHRQRAIPQDGRTVGVRATWRF